MRQARQGEVSYGPVDHWSLVHVAAGVLAEEYGLSFWTTVAIGSLFEVIEYPTFFPRSFTDTRQNAVTDILAVALGWWVAKNGPRGAEDKL